MNVINADIFVGALAIFLGLGSVSTGVFNWDQIYHLRKARWIESLCGRTGARIFFVVLGLILIALGSVVAMGYGLNKTRSSSDIKQRRLRHIGAVWAILPVELEVASGW